jgi:DNA-binding FrmR family transcriptional regulator
MTHTHAEKEKQKLLNRIRRVRGQLDAVERALEEEVGCAAILQQITACRGALDGLIAEVVEDHIREHVIDPKAARNDPRARAAEELVEIVHSFLT